MPASKSSTLWKSLAQMRRRDRSTAQASLLNEMEAVVIAAPVAKPDIPTRRRDESQGSQLWHGTNSITARYLWFVERYTFRAVLVFLGLFFVKTIFN